MSKTEKKSTKSRNYGGRPKKPLDYDVLRELVNMHCTAEECACVLKMSPDTLDRRLKEDGHTGFAEFFKQNSGSGKASLRRMQWAAAKGGNTAMLIWLGKQYLDQRDKQETTGRDGGPIQTEDVTKRDADEFASRMARLAAGSAQSGTESAGSKNPG